MKNIFLLLTIAVAPAMAQYIPPGGGGQAAFAFLNQGVTNGTPVPVTHNLGQQVVGYSCADHTTHAQVSISPTFTSTTQLTFTPSVSQTLDCYFSTLATGPTGATGAAGATGPSGGTIVVPNDGSTGTTLNLLAKINSSGNAIKTATTDTAVPAWVCISGCGTSGSATLEAAGSATCQADASGVTQGHFVINSTATAGRCADGGATAPTTGYVIGQAQSTAAANATFTLVAGAGYNAASGITNEYIIATETAAYGAISDGGHITFDTNTTGNASMHSTSSNTDRFVAVSNGLHVLICTYRISAISAGGLLVEARASTGVGFSQQGAGQTVAGDTATSYQATGIMYLTVGQYGFCNVDKLGSGGTATPNSSYTSGTFYRIQN